MEIVYFDMDNVLVNFQSGIEKLQTIDLINYEGKLDEVPGIFGLMEPNEGAIEAFHMISRFYDCYILSTAPWENDTAWSDKIKWVKKYLGEVAYKRLILSHNKNLNIGHYLIDDRTTNGAGEFTGEHIHFGYGDYKNWDDVVNYLLNEK